MSNAASENVLPTGVSTPPKMSFEPIDALYSHHSVDIPMAQELSRNLVPCEISIEKFIQNALGFDLETINTWRSVVNDLEKLQEVATTRTNYAYAIANGGELQLYKPFMALAQEIVNGSSEKSTSPLNITFVECASKPIPSDFGKRKPDIVIVPGNSGKSASVVQVQSWKPVLVAFEFKKDKGGVKRGAIDSVEHQSSDKRRRANPSESSSIGNLSVVRAAGSATSSTSQVSDISHINPNGTKVQLANYIAEMFACEVFREWAFGVTIVDDIFAIYYFDRTIAVASTPISIIKDFRDFALTVVALSACDFPKFGYSKIFRYRKEEDFTEMERSYIDIPAPSSMNIIDEKLNADGNKMLRLYVQEVVNKNRYGIFGRATTVRKIKVAKRSKTGWYSPDEISKVIKASWQVDRRTSEVEIIKKANGLDKDHTPEMYLSFDIKPSLPSEELVKLFNEQLINGLNYEKRSLRFIVFPEYRPLYELTGDAFLTAFKEILHCHYKLYKGGILHRDISIHNLMFYCVDEMHPIGILNDYDLSIILGPNNTSPAKPSSKHRTGTGPFMAIELLDQSKPVLHQYRHDLESFLYVLVWTAVGYKGSKYRASSNEKEPLRCWKGNWSDIRGSKILYLADEVTFEKVEGYVTKEYANLKLIISKFRDLLGSALQRANLARKDFQEKLGGKKIPGTLSSSEDAEKAFLKVLNESITWEKVSTIFELH